MEVLFRCLVAGSVHPAATLALGREKPWCVRGQLHPSFPSEPSNERKGEINGKTAFPSQGLTFKFQGRW